MSDRVAGPLGGGERGQSSVLMLGLAGALLAGFLVLSAFGQALGAKGRHQRGADLAAVSAARAMRGVYPRLFEPAALESGAVNPRHLSEAAYRGIARSAAVRAARANGLPLDAADVGFPGATFAPTRVSVAVRGTQRVRVKGSGRRAVRRVAVRARAEAELSPAGPAGMPALAEGGGYEGPLAYRNGKPMRPDVARAFDRMTAAARRESGIALTVTSGFRSDAEQARLFAANPNPKWVAPPRRSLHRLGTRARSRPARSLRVAGPKLGPVRLRQAVRLGALALRLHPQRRQLFGGLRPPPLRKGGRPALGGPAVVRAGALPRRDTRRLPTLQRRRRPARRSDLRRVASTRSRARRPARRESPSSCRGPLARTGCETPSTPRPPSPPRPA